MKKNFLIKKPKGVTIDFVILAVGAVFIAVGVGTSLASKVTTTIATISL